MKRILIVAVVVIGLVWFLNRGPSLDQFRDADPTGYDACVMYGDAQGAGGSVYTDMVGQAASLAVDAETEGIRDAVDDGTGDRDGAPVIDDLGDFEDACSDAGYEF